MQNRKETRHDFVSLLFTFQNTWLIVTFDSADAVSPVKTLSFALVFAFTAKGKREIQVDKFWKWEMSW